MPPRDPIKSPLPRLKVKAFEQIGAFDRALECVLDALAEDPADGETARHALRLFASLEDPAAHSRLLARLAGIGPRDPRALVFLAREDERAGHYDRASQWYARLIASRPDDANAWLGKGRCHLKVNELAPAREAFLQPLRIRGDRDALRWLFKVAQLQTIQKLPHEAIQTYRSILEVQPTEPTARMALLRLIYQSGDLERAWRTFEEMEAREDDVHRGDKAFEEPDSTGNATSAAHGDDGILTRLRRARLIRDARLGELILEGEVDPFPAKVRIQLDEGALDVKVPAGFASRVKAVYAPSEQRNLRADVIRRYIEAGESARALFHLGQLKSGDPIRDTWARCWMGILRLEGGDTERAREILSRLDIMPLARRGRRHLETLYRTAVSQMNVGESDAALFTFKRLLFIDYGYRDAASLLDILRHRTERQHHDMDHTQTLGGGGGGAKSPVPNGVRRIGGRYVLADRISDSHLGEIFRGQDERLDRGVALRRLTPSIVDSAQVRARFLEEARRAAILSHPVLAVPQDVIEEGRDVWIITPWISGRPLESHIADAPLDHASIRQLGTGLCDGLEHAHARNILHRDLKASDVMILDRRNQEDNLAVAILDVGLSQLANTLQTAPGDYLSRRAPYMSPEFVRGDRQDSRTDIYALGMILYVSWVGFPPFNGADLHAMLFEYLDSPLPPPSTLRPGLDSRLESVILACLRRDRDQRPASAAEVRVRLDPEGKEHS